MVRPPAPGAFARRVLRWYDRHKRDLPWRKTRDPYRILVSEIMLQQTQVDRVIPKYRQFLRKYPDLRTLSRSSPREVRKIWYPLGYNARPLRLHALARETVAKYGGRLPRDPEVLDTLPGIGRYTAGAVASIAFNRPAPALDTNIRRVLARVFHGRRLPPDAVLWRLAGTLVPADRPGDFNQALMDLGATVCPPRRPRCPVCPVRGGCRFAHLTPRTEPLTLPSPRKPGRGNGRKRGRE